MKKLLNLLFLFATVAFMGASEGKANPPPDYDDMVCAESSCTVREAAQDHQPALLFESPSIVGNLTEDRSAKPFNSTCFVELFEPPRWISGDSKCRLCEATAKGQIAGTTNSLHSYTDMFYPPSDSKARRCGKNRIIFKNTKGHTLIPSA